MSEKPSKPEAPSLETLVTDFEGIVREATRLTEAHVEPGTEEAAIFRLGKYKMDYLQPLIGKVHFETGDNSMEDATSEGVLDDEANNKLVQAINSIEHRVRELEMQKKPKAA